MPTSELKSLLCKSGIRLEGVELISSPSIEEPMIVLYGKKPRLRRVDATRRVTTELVKVPGKYWFRAPS